MHGMVKQLQQVDDTGMLKVTGGKVWYRIAGIEQKRIPLLTVHGGPGFCHDYLEPLQRLADERPVIFYDQLGCGNSERPNDNSLWTVERFVEELGQIRAELGLDQVHILGQSWGTMLTVDYLLTKPQGVISAVFSGPAISASRFAGDARAYLTELPPEIQQIISDCESRGEYLSPDYEKAVLEFYKQHLCRLDPWPDCLDRSFGKIGQDVYNYMWGPSEFTPLGILKDFERVPRLREIDLPVLLTCGRYDEATPEATRLYQSQLPKSEMYILEEASHNHHLEQEDEYLQVVRSFLHRCEDNL
jgi:proline iminopeptidase